MTHTYIVFVAVALLALSIAPMTAAQDTPVKPVKPVKRDPLTLDLSAHIAPAPAQVSARIRVEPDARSRGLLVEWWTLDGVGGSHLAALDGERAPARQDYPIKRMEPGEYIVNVVLFRNDGSQIRKHSRVVVVGEGSRFTAGPNGADLMLAPGSSQP